MSGRIEGERSIFPVLPYNVFMEFRRVYGSITPIGNISETEIADFCHGCDYLKPQNTCEELDSNTQAINAESKLCEVSKVSSIRGRMTENGFIPR